MSKILVPFHITDYTGSPGSVQSGFKKFYLKNGYFKLFDGAAVSDLVLDRPLDGFIPLIGTITSSDTVLTAIEKLQYEINSINTGMVGPGTPNRVTKFITASTIGDSLIYDNGTNVGFGTTTPIAKIHIVGNTGLAFSTNTLNWGMAYIKTVVMDSLIAPYEGDLTFSAPYWNGSLYSFPERVRIAAHTGNLGINTPAPTEKLHVVGNARITGAVYDSANLPGTAGQYLSSTVTGTSWASLPSLTGFVPTSRTLTINGTTYDLTANRSWTIPAFTSPLTTKGDLFTFNTVNARLPVGIDGQILTANSSTPEGLSWQDNYADWTSVVKHIVKNDGLNGTITKGTAVYVTGSNGTNMLVGRASNTSEATSSKTMGLMQSDITTTGTTQTGFVITEGLLSGLNTAGQTAGDPVWLGVNGALIYGLINKPYAPNHLVFIGIVTKVSAGNGEIFVKVQNGFELNEIHDVDLKTTTPTNGEVLGFDGTLWKNKTIASLLGYAPFQLPTLTSGSVLFSNGTTIAQDNANFFWDAVNIRLGIGTSSPNVAIHAKGSIRAADATGLLGILLTPANNTITVGGTTAVEVSGSNVYFGKAQNFLHLRTGSATRLYIDNTGNVGIGTTTPLTRLHVTSPANAVTGFVNLLSNSISFFGGYTGSFENYGLAHYNTATQVVMQSTFNGGPVPLAINKLGGNVIIGDSLDNGGKLQIKAPGALSTDIALRVRNSADTGDLATIGGTGVLFTQSLNVGFTGLGISYDTGIGLNIGSIGSGNGFTINLMDNSNNIYGFFGRVGSILTDRNATGRAVLTGTSALLEMQSTTKGFLPPRMTTTQKNAIATPASGLVVYDTTLGKLCVRGASAWETITSI